MLVNLIQVETQEENEISRFRCSLPDEYLPDGLQSLLLVAAISVKKAARIVQRDDVVRPFGFAAKVIRSADEYSVNIAP